MLAGTSRRSTRQKLARQAKLARFLLTQHNLPTILRIRRNCVFFINSRLSVGAVLNLLISLPGFVSRRFIASDYVGPKIVTRSGAICVGAAFDAHAKGVGWPARITVRNR